MLYKKRKADIQKNLINTYNKDFGKNILFIIVLIVVALCFCYVKSGYFLDEIYSYGLSNSEYAPFLTRVMGGDITEKVISFKELFGYVSAGDNRFNYASVYYNQTQDVHPPLYYYILHTVCSMFPDTFSKWLGLIPNMIFYVLTNYLLLKLSDNLFGHTTGISLSVVTLYGLSAAGLSTVLFVRMYMLMTFLTVLLAYIVTKLMKSESYYLYPVVSLVIFMGLMTHYYFVFYAFFICLFYVVYQWRRKQYRKVFVFSFLALLGVGNLFILFPECITQMAKGTGEGTTALQHLLDFKEYPARCLGLIRKITRDLFLSVILGGGYF